MEAAIPGQMQKRL